MKTTIEINGRIYDAQTGKIVSTSHENKLADRQNAKKIAPMQPLQRGIIMDGVNKRPVHQPSTRRSNLTAVKPSHLANQKSQTLNRKAVKKPVTPKAVPYVHSTSANIPSKVEHSATGRGMLLKRVPDVKLTRALHAKKSNLVSKFGKPTHQKPTIAPHIAVQPAPVATPSDATHATPHHNLQNQVAVATTQPTPTTHQASPPAKKFVFEDHIKQANSHLLKPVKKESRRKRILRSMKVSPKVVSAAAAVFALTLLGGFFAYQNIPAVSMRIAASKAGFPASLPSSIPAGYSFNGPVEVNEQVVSLKYDSNSDDRNFIITQKPTNWSSEALLTNYLLDSQFRYQVYKDKGLTIYVYDGSNATWVDKGVWYNVNGDEGSLSSEQLLELASSI